MTATYSADEAFGDDADGVNPLVTPTSWAPVDLADAVANRKADPPTLLARADELIE